jgi:uncharacterized membrane protein
MAVLALFAFAENDFDIAAPFRGWLDWELVALIGGLVVLISAGVVLTMKLRAAARPVGDDGTPEQKLEQYQEMLDQGIIDAKEYERIASLVRKQSPTPPTTS